MGFSSNIRDLVLEGNTIPLVIIVLCVVLAIGVGSILSFNKNKGWKSKLKNCLYIIGGRIRDSICSLFYNDRTQYPNMENTINN